MTGEPAAPRRIYIFCAVAFAPLGYVAGLYQSYFLKWSTDVLLVAPALAGALLGAAAIWDGVSDPLVAWTDRRRSRHGRRRPVIVAGFLLLAIAAPLIWAIPAGLGPTATAALLLAGLVLYQLAQTMADRPSVAYGVEVFASVRGRLRFNIAVWALFIIAQTIAFVAIGALSTAEAPRKALAPVLAPVVVLSLIAAAFAWFGLKEPSSLHRPSEGGVARMVRDVLGNPYHSAILVIQAAQAFALFSLGATLPYVFDVILGREDLLAVVLGVFTVFNVAPQPLYYLLAKRIGMVAAWRTGLVLWAAAFAIIGSLAFLPQETAVAVAFLAAAIAGLGNTSALMLVPILGDLVDYDADRTGHRREGLYVTVFGLISKLVAAGAAVFFGLLLDVGGYDPTAEVQSTGAVPAIVVSAGLLPFCATLFGVQRAGRWRFYPETGRSDRPGVDAAARRTMMEAEASGFEAS